MWHNLKASLTSASLPWQWLSLSEQCGAAYVQALTPSGLKGAAAVHGIA
jgi:hypothetical protein